MRHAKSKQQCMRPAAHNNPRVSLVEARVGACNLVPRDLNAILLIKSLEHHFAGATADEFTL
jgi:hypothetical protein